MTIYTECKADTALLIAILGVSKREVVHETKGKDEVCKSLQRNTRSTGMIDEDPGAVQPLYLKSLMLQEDLPERGLKRFLDQARGNYLVVLCPRLEEWILRTAAESGLKTQDYGLPDSPSPLHRRLEHETGQFIQLVNDLKNSSRISNLRRLLRQVR